MAPARNPDLGDLPIMKQQEVILTVFVFSCVVMLWVVVMADRRATKSRLQTPSAPQRSTSSDSSDSRASSPRFKGTGVEPSETTPLLSPDSPLTPESTIVGSGSASLTTKRSDSSGSWLSMTDDDIQRAVSTQDELARR